MLISALVFLSGFILSLKCLCSPLADSELFQDDFFFGMPDESEDEDEVATTVQDVEEVRRVCKHAEHKQIVREVSK